MEQFELDLRNREKRTNFSLFEHFSRTIPIPIVQKFNTIIEEKIAEFTLTKNEQLFELYLSNPTKAHANQMDTKIVFFSAPLIKTLLAKKFAEKLKNDLTKSFENTCETKSKLPNTAIDFLLSKGGKNISKRNYKKLTNLNFRALPPNQQSIVAGVNFNDVHVEMVNSEKFSASGEQTEFKQNEQITNMTNLGLCTILCNKFLFKSVPIKN